MKKTYYAVVDGHINGAYRKKGESCGEMTARQAKYLVMSGLVTDQKAKPVDPVKRAEPDPATLERKTR